MRQKEKSEVKRAMPSTWSEAEMRALVEAWSAEMAREQARARPRGAVKLSADIHRSFLERTGETPEVRPITAVAVKRNSLRILYQSICAFNEKQEKNGGRTWFNLPKSRQRRVRQGWTISKKSMCTMSEDLFNLMTRKFANVPMHLVSTRAHKKSIGTSMEKKDEDSGDERMLSRAQWSYLECMKVAEASAELDAYHVKTRRPHQVRLYRAYLRLGGLANRSMAAVSKQALVLKDVHRFIAIYNKQALLTGEKEWHQLSKFVRSHLGKDYTGPKSTLALVDFKMFQVLGGKSTLSARKPTSHYTSVSRTTSTHNSLSGEIRRVTESVKYELSRGEELVSVDEKRSIRSARIVSQGKRPPIIDVDEEEEDEENDDDEEDAHDDEDDEKGDEDDEYEDDEDDEGDEDDEEDGRETEEDSEDEEEESPPQQMIQRTRKRLRTRHTEEESSLQLQRRKRDRHADAVAVSGNNDYQSVLEDTVATMSSQLAELDRQMTENRINENKRALVSVLRACRRSRPGPKASALAGEMLKRAGANMLQIAKLVNQQREQDGAVMERLLSALHEEERSR